jgi:Putative transposase
LLVIAILRETSQAGHLESVIRDELETLLQFEEKRRWIAHVRGFKGKEHFLRYCGRYVRRPPMAQWRILAISNGCVKFWHKDKRLNRWITVQCTLEVFIDRWSKHIPKLYRHSVRYFGLFAPRRWHRVAAAIFTILGKKQRTRPKRLRWAIAVQQFRRNPLLDHNKQPLAFVRHLPPAV